MPAASGFPLAQSPSRLPLRSRPTEAPTSFRSSSVALPLHIYVPSAISLSSRVESCTRLPDAASGCRIAFPATDLAAIASISSCSFVLVGFVAVLRFLTLPLGRGIL